MSEYVHVVIEHEELFPAVLHDVLAEVVDEIGDGDGLAVLVVGWDGELVLALVREEHLEAAPEESQYMTFCLLPLFLSFHKACCLLLEHCHRAPFITKRKPSYEEHGKHSNVVCGSRLIFHMTPRDWGP